MDTNKLEVGCKNLFQQLKKLPEECSQTRSFEFCKLLIENYKQTIPLLSNLKQDCLRKRHWKKIEEVCKTQFVSEQENIDLSLGQILALNLLMYQDEINDIVQGAGKEQKIEQQLQEI